MSLGFSVRTRQAPSPTGYLHIGTTRQIIFSALFAKSYDGSWFLRLEDTDQKRLVTDSAKNLVKTLQDLQLEIPEGITLKQTAVYYPEYDIYEEGEAGPYIQSHRHDLYKKYAQILIDQKLAYWNFLSTEEKTELQSIKQINHLPIDYFNICSEKFFDKLFLDVETALNLPQKPALMFRLNRLEKLACYDLLLGKTQFDLSLEEDFVILKSDGLATYHFAHPIDDFLMGTTLVIRAQEWYASLPKHITLFQALWGNNKSELIVSDNGRNVPNYLHLPFILGTTGNKKLSKRDGVVNMASYLKQGYLPEALINYMSFLGFNPGTEKELYLEDTDFEF